MKSNPSLKPVVRITSTLILFCVAHANGFAQLERIEAGPQGSSMRGRLTAATDVQFGVHVSGTPDQKIQKLQRELRLLQFTRDVFPALSRPISLAGTNMTMSRCANELSRLAGKAIPIDLRTNDFSTREFVFRDLPLVDALKYLVAFNDAILDVSEGKLVCRSVSQGLALKAEEYDLLKLMTSRNTMKLNRFWSRSAQPYGISETRTNRRCFILPPGTIRRRSSVGCWSLGRT